MWNVETPTISCTRVIVAQESELQGEPTGRRVWEDGKSEGRFVMKRIRIETVSGTKVRPRPSGASLRKSLENR
jgi:hypothetical protein